MNDNDYEIYKLLNPMNNDKLSDCNKHELEELIYYINHYYLEYRKFLGIPRDVSIGLELECEDIFSYDLIREEIADDKLLGGWKVTYDPTLSYGCEVKSPKLFDYELCWKQLAKACDILRDYARIGKDCGAHVHIGSRILGKERVSWLNFIKLWAAYEDVIFRFGYGEYLTHRPGVAGYAHMLAYEFLEDYDYLLSFPLMSFENIAKKISHCRKSQAVNFKNVGNKFKNTIEFRCPNGTLNPIVWQNNVNLFVHLLEYSKSVNFNDHIVLGRCSEINRRSVSLALYKKIYLEKAVELCDLIFDNNLDKIYFLRQYLKDYEIGFTFMEEARPFTKKLV